MAFEGYLNTKLLNTKLVVQNTMES